MITLDSILPKPFSFVHFNMIQPVSTWTVCDPDETRSNEMSRRNTIKTWTHQTSKEWDGISLSPDLKKFWNNRWKNIKNSGHTDLTFKPWSSQSNYQPKNNWHKFVRLYLDYFLSKINNFIPGKLKKSKFWESLLIYIKVGD